MIPAIGHQFNLGMLHDRRRNTLISGETLWLPEQMKETVQKLQELMKSLQKIQILTKQMNLTWMQRLTW